MFQEEYDEGNNFELYKLLGIIHLVYAQYFPKTNISYPLIHLHMYKLVFQKTLHIRTK